jgi:hypothetical protein
MPALAVAGEGVGGDLGEGVVDRDDLDRLAEEPIVELDPATIQRDITIAHSR